MSVPRMYSRARTLLLAVLLVSILTWTFSRRRSVSYTRLDTTDRETTVKTLDESSTYLDSEGIGVPHNKNGHIHFWQQFHPLLAKYQPKCLPPLRFGNAPSIRFEEADPGDRQEYLDMLPDEVKDMKDAHSGFVSDITTNLPQLHYIPQTRGLVSTAGGSLLPVLVISLRMLRKTGSKLPVEVFLANEEEYEEYICNVVLPSLNARCVVLSHVLDAVPRTMHIEKYQFKLFAMLFSSFEEILFLDADAFPVEKPEILFSNEPFRSTNMITWPDFWADTVSSYYYEIASKPMPAHTVRQSSESGEVLISKKTHAKTLLLSAYYNIWGPEYYYALLSQGAAGEGDKETFVAAALTMEEPYYQVSEPIVAIGHRTKNGLAGSAMVQFDPVEDYALTQKGKFRVHGSKAPAPRAFFIHANFPKFDPATVFAKQAVTPTFNDDGSYTRAWTVPKEVIGNFNTDVEKQFWKEILWTACELETKFSSWSDRRGICKPVKNFWNAVFSKSKT